jgi:hypothetical protein
MYNQHHNNKLNRYKVRQRTYEESGQSYLEIKFKSNKGRTIKNRIETQNTAFPFEANNFEFLTTHLPFNPNTLKPMAWINYSRITLISKQCSEKLTLDLDLEFKKDTESYNLTGLVIAEVKQTQPAPSHFLKVMKKLGLSADAMSKYCFAIAFTNREVKKNNFKEKLLALKQIIRHDADSNIYRNFKQQ